VREVDTVARLGGDEFMVLTAELGADEGLAAAGIEMIAKDTHGPQPPFPLGLPSIAARRVLASPCSRANARRSTI